MSDTPRHIGADDLSPQEQRALLAQILREKAGESASVHPLSYGQRSLWFLYQIAPESVAYNEIFAWRIRSDVDIPALRRAFQTLVDRHSSLRTTYGMQDGRPIQQVHPHMKVHFEVIDASTWSRDELDEHLVKEAHRPFDLGRGPVLRVSLFARSAEEHVLLLTVHHIAIDLWSLTVLMDELRVLYPAEKAGLLASPLPLSLPYDEFVRWQSKMLAGPEGKRLLKYWQKQLAGELPVLDLPTDRPRPVVQAFDGASHTFKLDEQLTAQLRALAKAEGVTLYTIILAAFQALLYRYTQQKDILVGSPMAGRSRAEFEKIVGYFVNMVVLRADLSDNPTFESFLQRVRQTVLAALQHQDYPFPLLIERLQPPRDPSRSPVFQIVFSWDNPRAEEQMDLGGLVLEPYDLKQQLAKFDLTLMMIELGESLSATFQYNTALFDASTIARMGRHFQTLLEGIVVNPGQRVSDLPLLTDTERHQLLVAWNDTKTDYPKDRCIHELFEAQVERTPDAVAMVFEDQHLTYRELNCRANQLAHHLRTIGVGPEVLVGICMERSLEMVVGILGILKAGGAYVPLDSAYPRERLAFMLEDIRSPVLLIQRRLVESMPECKARVVYLDADWEAIAQQGEANPVNEATAENLAYVMYTSGSTGRPKGISVTHRGVVRLVKETNYADLTEAEVFLQFAPISFDASTLEIWGPLLNGGRLVVFPADVPSLEELGEALKRYHITTLWLTAGLFHLMVDERLEDLGHLHQLLAGGDVLSVSHVKRFLQELDGECVLINGYGPTENTTFTCCYAMTDASQVGQTVSIGRPIANTTVYVLDSHLRPVPVGVPGELCIGGDGLARGYLNRPGLTAEKFIPNPLGDEPGARLYRTGDLVRYLPDGGIEFLGRRDFQVKIRGFRVELGEIEAVLSQHPGVRETVVVAHEDEPDDPSSQLRTGKRLVAYVVADEGQEPMVSELRRFLEAQLPDYMVPSTFVMLEALPLTPNGKLDRQALPVPVGLRPELEPAYVAPQTEVERIIAQIWQEVLGVDRIGSHDNFFDLGGHSLLMVQVHDQLQKTIGGNLPIVEMFRYPTVSALAKYLRQEQEVYISAERIQDRVQRQAEAIRRQKQLAANLKGQAR